MTLNEALGYALGVIGLSYDDFCGLNFEEWKSVLEAHAKYTDFLHKDRWDAMRTGAVLSIMPHIKKSASTNPKKILPFSWDKIEGETENISIEERRQRAFERLKRMEDLKNG